MPTTEIRYDTNNVYSWDRIETVYDDFGVILSKHIFLDSGFEVLVNYADGVLSEKHEYDNSPGGNFLSFEQRSTTYDATGSITQRYIAWDTGKTKTVNYSDGLLTSVYQSDNSTGNLAASWSSIATLYDAAGLVSSTTINFDDGSVSSRTYIAGVISQISEIDNQTTKEANLWDTKVANYDAAGLLSERITQFDNGVEKIEYFVNGVIESVDQYDNGTEVSWDNMYIGYDVNGLLDFKEIIFDDGIVATTFYTNGQRELVLMSDTTTAGAGSLKNWSNIRIDYEANGARLYRKTDYDDGMLKEEFYVAGSLDRLLLTDQFNIKDWAVTENIYDQYGVSYSAVTYDNGLLKEEFYNTGVRERFVETDVLDVFTWATKVKLFDLAGNLDAVVLTFDNGVNRQELYSNGLRQTMTETDVANALNWSTINTYYDVNGDRAQVDTVYDNAVEKSVYFQNGAVEFYYLQDIGNANTWAEIASVYRADGTQEATSTVYDNLDELIFVKELDGTTTDFRIEVDGDGSSTWAVRVTDYASGGGSPVVTAYDNEIDVPLPYSDYLGSVAAV